MKNNVGTTDKIIRYVLAAVFIVLGLILSYWWFIGAVIMIVTAITGWCPIYAIFGMKTNKNK